MTTSWRDWSFEGFAREHIAAMRVKQLQAEQLDAKTRSEDVLRAEGLV